MNYLIKTMIFYIKNKLFYNSICRPVWIGLQGCFIFLIILCVYSCGEIDKSGNGLSKKTQSINPFNNEKINDPVLRVEKTFYTNQDFLHFIKIAAGEDFQTLPPESLSRFYDDFIKEKLMLEGAYKSGLSLTEEEKQEILKKFENENPSAENFGNTISPAFQSYINRIQIEKFLASFAKNITVSSEKIVDYYNKNKNRFLKSERVKVSQILCKTESDAVHILGKLKNKDETTFRNIAKLESIGIEASKGGEMGIFEMGHLPKDMENIIFSLKESQISDILKSTYGFHIFRLDKKFDAELLSEEKSKSEIKTILLEQKYKSVLNGKEEKLRQTLDWEQYTDNLIFPYKRISNE